MLEFVLESMGLFGLSVASFILHHSVGSTILEELLYTDELLLVSESFQGLKRKLEVWSD